MKLSKVDQKKPVIDEISELLKDAKSAVAVDYLGLTVEQDTQLRKQLREANVTYKVYKNTMLHIAAKGTQFESMLDMFKGPTAIAVSKDDSTAPARVLYNFAKTAEAMSIKGGIVEGTLYDENTIKEIATIPSREELLGRLFGSMQSPITNFARVLKQIAEKAPEGDAPAEAAASEVQVADAAPSMPEAAAEEAAMQTPDAAPEGDAPQA